MAHRRRPQGHGEAVVIEPIPYGRQSIDQSDIDAVVAALSSDFLTTGPAVDRFEVDLAAHVGAPAVAVSSGTAALHSAYAAAGVGPGTHVVTSPLTFVATASVALHLGAQVAFCDIEDDYLTLDPAELEPLMGDTTSVVAPVDFAGHPADVDPIRSIAAESGAVVVSDASHSIGGTYRGRPIGSVADLTTFSFHPVKTVTTGEGGAVSGTDETLLERVRRFRNHGLVSHPSLLQRHDEGAWHREVPEIGLNYRMPDVLAALGSSQLRRLDGFVEARRRLARRYHAMLAGIEGIRLPGTADWAEPAWHLYAIRVLGGRRRRVYDAMHRAGVRVQVHYLPVHLHPAFEDLGFKEGMYPIAEKAYRELLSLPLYPDLTDAQQDRVVEALVAALR